MKAEKILSYLAIGFLLLFTFALGLKLLSEPDLWWIIRTGEWIVENGQVPTEDTFSFTFSGTEWINVKWGYEVLTFFITDLFGPAYIAVLQGIINLSMLFLIIQISRVSFSGVARNPILLGLIVVVLFACEYRMTGRPETVSHLFMLLSFYLFQKSKASDWKWAFGLLGLQVIWANFHEAYGVGYGLAAIYVLSTLLEVFWIKNRERKEGLKLAAVYVIVPLGAIINPRGFQMLLHPLEILGQLSDNKFTTELYNAFTPAYWELYQSYVAVLLVLLAVTILLYAKLVKKHNLIVVWSPAYFLVAGLFLYLSFSAQRNIPFLVLWLAPFFIKEIDEISANWILGSKAIVLTSVSLLLALGAHVFLVSGNYYQVSGQANLYGIGVNKRDNPIGASQYLAAQENIGNVFSDFLVSSYLMWDLRPGFKTYIDFRDLDVFSAEFFQKFSQMTFYTDMFAAEDSTYHFSHVVLNRTQFPGLHQYFFAQPNWQIAYADPVAVVFKKGTDVPYRSDSIFGDLKMLSEPSRLASIISLGLVAYPESVNHAAVAVDYYLSNAQYDMAVMEGEEAVRLAAQPDIAYAAMLKAYLFKTSTATDPSVKDLTMQKVSQDVTTGLQKFAESPAVLNAAADVYMYTGQFDYALSLLGKSSKIDQSNITTYTLQRDCNAALINQNANGVTGYFKAYASALENIVRLAPSDQLASMQLGIAYCQLNECDKASSLLADFTPFPGLTEQDKQNIQTCKVNCSF